MSFRLPTEGFRVAGQGGSSGAATSLAAGCTGSDLTLSGALAAGASTLASAAVTGNATVGGTLGVTGTTTLGVLVAAATTLASLAVTAAATIGTTLAAGASTLASLIVTAAASIGTTLGVTGTSTLAGVNAGATTTTTLNASGAAVFQSTLNAQGAADFDSTVNHDGDVTMAGTSQIFLNDGSATDPVLAFSGDTDTGISRASSSMRLYFGGTQVVSVAAALATFNGNVALSSGFRPAAAATKTSNYTASSSDLILIMSGTTLTLTLPASPASNQVLWVKNLDATNLTVGRNSKTIDGAASDLTLVTGAQALLYYDGTGWNRIGA